MNEANTTESTCEEQGEQVVRAEVYNDRRCSWNEVETTKQSLIVQAEIKEIQLLKQKQKMIN